MYIYQLRICEGTERHRRAFISDIDDLKASCTCNAEHDFTRVMPGRGLVGAHLREPVRIGIVRIRSGYRSEFGQAGWVRQADEPQPTCVSSRNIQDRRERAVRHVGT